MQVQNYMLYEFPGVYSQIRISISVLIRNMLSEDLRDGIAVSQSHLSDPYATFHLCYCNHAEISDPRPIRTDHGPINDDLDRPCPGNSTVITIMLNPTVESPTSIQHDEGGL